jgi:hypothetical protein
MLEERQYPCLVSFSAKAARSEVVGRRRKVNKLNRLMTAALVLMLVTGCSIGGDAEKPTTQADLAPTAMTSPTTEPTQVPTTQPSATFTLPPPSPTEPPPTEKPTDQPAATAEPTSTATPVPTKPVVTSDAVAGIVTGLEGLPIDEFF